MSAGRKFWAIVCCGLCMFFPWAASGCSARGNFGVDSGIYLITKGSDSVFWRSVKSGADAAAAEYNVFGRSGKRAERVFRKGDCGKTRSRCDFRHQL